MGSQNAVLLSKWLDDDPDHMAAMIGVGGTPSNLDWMMLALSGLGNQAQTKKIGQAFVEKMLAKGDIHAAATILLSLGDENDAIEVYVTRNYFMEAILLTCLLRPSDWQRQSFLVRRWGEHVVENSQQHLAIRCFSCTGVEPSEPWTSPTAQRAAGSGSGSDSELQVATGLLGCANTSCYASSTSAFWIGSFGCPYDNKEFGPEAYYILCTTKPQHV
jgi:hypothetical protein